MISVKEALIAIGWALLLAAGFVIGSCRPASAQDKVFAVSEWAVLTGHGLDTASTQRAIGEHRGVEANPFLAQFNNPLAFTAAKFAIGGGQLWLMRKLKPSHPKLATLTNFAIAGMFTSIAIRNQRVGK